MTRILSFLGAVLAMSTMAFAQDTPRPAKVFTVAEQSTTIVRRYPGIVLPSQELELSFRISGNLVELPIRASQHVSKGDVIGQLDTRDLKTQATQLQSSVDQAQAQLDALEAGARPQEIAAQEAAVDAASARRNQAQEQTERSRELAERGTISEATLEQDEAALRVALAELRSMQEQLSLMREGTRSEEIAAAEASLRGLKAQLQSVNDSISDATLRAPFDGVIARRDVDNFINIQAGQSIILLQALNVIHVSFDVPGPDVTTLSAGGLEKITNTVMLDALPDQEFPSETVEFSLQAASGTQTYRGRVAVNVPQDLPILPGMVGTVVASAPGKPASLQVPLTAVAAASDGSAKVWIVDDTDTVNERPVTLGQIFGANVEVVDGLQAGDRVVSAGISALQPGMTIRPIAKVGG